MDALGTGLILIANGFMQMAGHVLDPISIIGVFLLAAALWLAGIETEELNRQGTKPEIGRH